MSITKDAQWNQHVRGSRDVRKLIGVALILVLGATPALAGSRIGGDDDRDDDNERRA